MKFWSAIAVFSLAVCITSPEAAQAAKQDSAEPAPAAKQGAPVPQMQPAPAPPLQQPKEWHPPQEGGGVEKVGPGMYRLGEIRIDKKLKGITFPAVVNMEKGLLEYLLVRTGGKTHESLLRTAVQPTDLQVALLLLGLEGTDRPLAAQGDPAQPAGERLEIRLTFTNSAGKGASVNPEAWIARQVAAATVQPEKMSWVFTGSMIRDQRFLAQAEGSIIAVYHDPVALIDNASAGAESDLHWFVNEKSVPPVGTPVMVTIRAAK